MPRGLSDPDLKAMASLPLAADERSKAAESGESIAAKGEVNADNQRAKTPAERLGLFDQKTRAKSEKCLAEAVYFEARGEAVRGQIAVAQVVMNRTFSGFYPTTVCGVVYQNKHRHYACQFTFACDNVADVVREPEMWDRAKKIAKAVLDGQLWLPEVGKSTHYHAYWVRPSWVHEMKKMYKFGVHTFYRPRAWGDGSDAPSWGTPAKTAAISAELAEEAKSSAELSGSTVHR
jgi:spore germination cell wall hydrolase CwlJ-like protein